MSSPYGKFAIILGPFPMRFSALYRPHTPVQHARLNAHADRMLPGACNPISCPIHISQAILESNNDAAPAPGTPPALPGHWSSSGDLTNKSATDIFMDIVAASMDSVMALARDSNANP